MDGLLSLLAENVTTYSDGGGKAKAAGCPSRAPAWSCASCWASGEGAAQRGPRRDEGEQAAGLRDDASTASRATCVSFDVADDRIQAIYIVVNPDKLARVRL